MGPKGKKKAGKQLKKKAKKDATQRREASWKNSSALGNITGTGKREDMGRFNRRFAEVENCVERGEERQTNSRKKRGKPEPWG